MSLLMKALANAEKEKSDKTRPEQAPNIARDDARTENVGNVSPFPSVNATKSPLTQQEAAANVFSAARLPDSYFKHALWGLAFTTLALSIWLGMQLLPTFSNATQPLTAQNNTGAAAPSTVQILASPVALDSLPPTEANQAIVTQQITQKSLFSPPQPLQTQVVATQTKVTEPVNIVRAVATETPASEKKSVTTLHNSALQLTLKKTDPAVDPALLSAYQAFQQDDLSQAQQLYRQMLKNDVRNLDALLGMAAIAQKQGRNSDALGWYQKVLALEPTHAMALAATVELQPSADNDSQRAYLKNLIAQQPENPHFYAALGNLYAEQEHWQEAQAAYFESVRYAPHSAEFIFNLAVSLEHLNQPQLALTQYQRALQLIERTGAASVDAQSIKNRIIALQPAP